MPFTASASAEPGPVKTSINVPPRPKRFSMSPTTGNGVESLSHISKIGPPIVSALSTKPRFSAFRNWLASRLTSLTRTTGFSPNDELSSEGFISAPARFQFTPSVLKNFGTIASVSKFDVSFSDGVASPVRIVPMMKLPAASAAVRCPSPSSSARPMCASSSGAPAVVLTEYGTKPIVPVVLMPLAPASKCKSSSTKLVPLLST